jgi:hypothetical protein
MRERGCVLCLLVVEMILDAVPVRPNSNLSGILLGESSMCMSRAGLFEGRAPGCLRDCLSMNSVALPAVVFGGRISIAVYLWREA